MRKGGYYQDPDATCADCGEPCGIEVGNDSFDYAGTHCTGGKPGIHRLPNYPMSSCCNADIEGCDPEWEDFPW